jgi:transposase
VPRDADALRAENGRLREANERLRKPPERRAGRGGGRKPGKQPGAPGAYLAWSQDPDTIVDHFPQGRCTRGADLSGAADLGVRYSHQVAELPDTRALTVQHDRHEARCGCGRVHAAGAPRKRRARRARSPTG